MSTRDTLRVELGARSYDIIVGSNLLAEAGALVAPVVRSKRAVIVTDENVAKLHLPALQAGLTQGGIAYHTIVLPPGEATKDFAHFSALCEDILALGIERATPLIALGGGVIGDLTGFAAATLLRGLDYVQVPTTLLSQVDSSVGGKTAIDSRHGKNLIGAFHQPVRVLADIETLSTLPRRELLAGYAEVVKYGLIRDHAFYDWLEQAGVRLVDGDTDARRRAVLTSCAAKAHIVAIDEREVAERQLLNFGHTFGHALEVETGFGDALLHGEAVAMGMGLAFDLSAELGICPKPSVERVKRHFAAVGLPVALKQIANGQFVKEGRFAAADLLRNMGKDKKVRDGRITLILAHEIGDAFIARDVERATLESFLATVTGAPAPV